MRKWILPVGFVLLSSQVQALTSITAFKVFTRETLTSSDLNSSFTTVITGVNNLIAKFPGDSVKTTFGAFDSLLARPGPNLVVLDPLVSKSADDSLNYHLANIERLNVDSLYIGGTPVVGFSLASTAGERSLFSHANAETLTVGTGETVIGDDTDIKIVSGESIDLTATTDVIIPTSVGVTFGTGEKIEGDDTDITVTSGGAINLTAVTDVVVPTSVGVTFGTGEKIEGDDTDLTVTSGGAINLTGVTDVVIPTSVGVTFGTGEKIEGDDTDLTITSGGDINLSATVNVVMSGAASILMPTALTMPSGTDGHVLTSDANGVVKLEANPGSTTDTDSTLANAGGSTVGVRVDENGNTIVNGNLTVASSNVVFTNATSVLLPSALTFASGTDGQVLTSDDNGRVILEAISHPAQSSTANLTDSTRITLVDTTIAAASVSVIEAYDLTNPMHMQDIGKFRMKEMATSLHDSLGLWPTKFTVHITTAQDCVVVMDRGSGGKVTEYLTITLGSDNATGVHFLDGVLRISTSVGLYEMDVQNDKLWLYDTGGQKTTKADLASDIVLGTDAVTFVVVKAALAIATATVNGTSAIRDPFDPGSGKQWWVAATSDESSLYNPYTEAIYDGAFCGTCPMRDVRLDPRGTMGVIYNYGAADVFAIPRSILDSTADGWAYDNTAWYNAMSGSQDIDWANDVVMSSFATLNGQSAAGTNANAYMLAADVGLYVMHTKQGDIYKGGKVLINDDAFGPYEKGTSIGAWPLHSTTDFSINSHDLTNNNTVTFATGGPTGNYADFVAGNSESLEVADHATFGPVNEISAGCWFYRDIDSGGNEYLISHYNVSSGSNEFALRIEGSDYLNFHIDTGGTTDMYTAAVTTGQWYYVVGTYDGVTQKIYLNGNLVTSGAAAGATDNGTGPLMIGAADNAGTPQDFFDGKIAGAFYSGTAMTAEEIKGIWEAGQAMLQVGSDATAGLDAASVVAVDCIDEGWCASASVDSVQVWKYIAPMLVPWKRYLGPGAASITDVALWWDGGADSVALAIGTAADLQLIQPDPNIYAAATYRNPWVQPLAVHGGVVPVDSSGVLGVFWHPKDAVTAGSNANKRHIMLQEGRVPTYTHTEDSMHVEGVSYGAILSGDMIGDGGLYVNGGTHNIFENFSVECTGGGVCGTSRVNGAVYSYPRGSVHNSYIGLDIWDNDGIACFTIDGDYPKVLFNVCRDSDARDFIFGSGTGGHHGIYIGNKSFTVATNTHASADTSIFIGNDFSGSTNFTAGGAANNASANIITADAVTGGTEDGTNEVP